MCVCVCVCVCVCGCSCDGAIAYQMGLVLASIFRVGCNDSVARGTAVASLLGCRERRGTQQLLLTLTSVDSVSWWMYYSLYWHTLELYMTEK